MPAGLKREAAVEQTGSCFFRQSDVCHKKLHRRRITAHKIGSGKTSFGQFPTYLDEGLLDKVAENYLHKEGSALPVKRSARILTQEFDPCQGDSHGDIRLSAHPKLSGKTPVGVWTNR